MSWEDIGRAKLLWLAILFEGGLGVLALGLGWFFEIPVWEKICWDWQELGWGMAASVPMLAIFALCLFGTWPALVRIQQITRDFIQPLFHQCNLIDLAFISVLAGVGEEMLFRGLLQTALSELLGWPAGIALASLLFGLLHPITPTYMVLATLVGIYLGFLTHFREGNLLLVITAHGVYDFVALVYLVKTPCHQIIDRG